MICLSCLAVKITGGKRTTYIKLKLSNQRLSPEANRSDSLAWLIVVIGHLHHATGFWFIVVHLHLAIWATITAFWEIGASLSEGESLGLRVRNGEGIELACCHLRCLEVVSNWATCACEGTVICGSTPDDGRPVVYLACAQIGNQHLARLHVYDLLHHAAHLRLVISHLHHAAGLRILIVGYHLWWLNGRLSLVFLRAEQRSIVQ